MTSAVSIRPARRSDVQDMTVVHLAAFPNFFLTSLGARTLNVFYTHVLQCRDGVAYVAIDRATTACVGLVAGTVDLAEFRNQQRRAWLIHYAAAAAPALARDPTRVNGLLAALRSADPGGNAPPASLMSLAVLPERAGSGIGRQLVQAFSSEMQGLGHDSYALTTDADGNDSVNHFYETVGFRLNNQWARSDGRRMNVYEIDLTAPQPDSAR